MQREEIYVETSAWSFVFADDEPARKAATERFFNVTRDADLLIAELVIAEIELARNPKRDLILGYIKDRRPNVLPDAKEVTVLAEEYVNRGIIPPKYVADALHIAFAGYYSLNAIISWNFEHIVKVKTRREVRAVNTILGYAAPEIATPEEYTGGI